MDLSVIILRISNSYSNLYKYLFCKAADLNILQPRYVSGLVAILTSYFIFD